ncbi:MAG: hypothetical protein ABI775_09040 [Pseudonocardiales bacterium]|nr:hypothetical protein [Actinomycetota bacterium]
MKPGTRIAGFAVALAAVLGGGAAVGAAIGPTPNKAPAMEPAPIGEGVVSAADGYRLVPAARIVPAAGGAFRFVVDGPDGTPVHRFTSLHERDLHLIVANRELTSFHHVHPTLAADGTWSIMLPALAPGSYRATADFHVTGGPRLALGTDLTVPGDYEPSAAPEPTATSTVDGYEVSIATRRHTGGEVTAALTVRQGGHPVTDLQPYLGAYGHLVALRAGDLAYAHVHPVGHHAGMITFDATLSAQGRYRLFLDFKHAGAVHTAAFTFDQGVVTDAPKMGH